MFIREIARSVATYLVDVGRVWSAEFVGGLSLAELRIGGTYHASKECSNLGVCLT